MENSRLQRQNIINLLESGHWQEALAALEVLQPFDIAFVLKDLSQPGQLQILSLVHPEEGSEALTHLDPELQADLIAVLPREKAVELLGHMSPDDVTDLVGELPRIRREQILELLENQNRGNVRQLLNYPANSAGGIMTTELFTVSHDFTVSQTMDLLHQKADEVEVIYYLYVVNEGGQLTGVVSLRDLVLAGPETHILEIMDTSLVTVPLNMPQEEAARRLKKYDFNALPVVDQEGRPVGVITADDVIDILEEEATEDFSRHAAISGRSRSVDDLNVPSFEAARRRLPWLATLLLVGIMAGTIISQFEETLEAVVTLAIFIPMIADMAGNTGTQSLALVVRRMALGEFGFGEAVRLIRREAGVGVIIGVVNGSLIAIVAAIWQGSIVLGLVVGVSLSLTLFFATLAGATVPLLLNRFKVDPAIASGPFITTINDILGLTIYFTMATIFMAYLN